MKSFFWMVVFPVLPWALGVSAAAGCDAAGVNVYPWWVVIAVSVVLGAVLFTCYGYRKGDRYA